MSTAAMFAESGSGEIKTTEYTLKPIIFVVPKGSSAGLDDQRRREAEAFRGRFAGCDGVVEQARQLKEVVVREHDPPHVGGARRDRPERARHPGERGPAS